MISKWTISIEIKHIRLTAVPVAQKLSKQAENIENVKI